MKVKTSITLSDYLIEEIDQIVDESGNRSNFIEEAVKLYIQYKKREIRDINDFDLINQNSKALNKEAEDVLSFQVEF